METKKILSDATAILGDLIGSTFDVLHVSKPSSLEAALNLANIISKLSPMVGNLIEFAATELLNARGAHAMLGKWVRQDPGFPDTVFRGDISPAPGIEIKTWFPLSTEITARFNGSQNTFSDGAVNVCLLAWMPESLIYGKPKITDICIVPALSVAQARDNHYHNPPTYLVLEPESTTERSENLRQINTAGYKWQGNAAQLKAATKIVESWGADGNIYQPTSQYGKLVRDLRSRFPYRLDTNYAKIDRINHTEIESFKFRVLSAPFKNSTVGEWSRLLKNKNNTKIENALKLLL